VKIAYDHQFFSMFGYSGITRYFYELISRLSCEAGMSVSLFMGWNINEFDFAEYRKNYAHFFGAKRPHVPKTTRLFNTLNNALFPLFLYRSGADLYHQTYYRFHVPNFAGRRVLTVYDMTYELFPEKFDCHDPVVREKRTSMDRADALIAISENTKNDMVRLCGIPRERVTVVHLANSLTAPPRARPPLDGPYILYVGQRVPHKNFMRLLAAYCQSTRVHAAFKLLCFGGGPETPEEQAVLSGHGCGGRMHHCTGNDELLASCYSHAAALVYPSLYEGFGLPLVEAMHYGCPVIASNAGSLPEVGADAGVYFDPSNTGEIMERMELVLFGDTLRATMIERGRRREKDFGWDACAAKTRAVYASLL
jgi:glycosyltransferase involved in cell wall biosynthesis